MATNPKAREAKRRLEELQINELSLVDSPAVGQSFLVAKKVTPGESTEIDSDDFRHVALKKAHKTEKFWIEQYAIMKLDLERLKAKTRKE